jgi:acyl-lipid omega-6 desaturase (Delta-12 desaturase)
LELVDADRRDRGNHGTLTVREYLSRSWRDRLRYRLYRHPLVMFGVGPIYLFLIENRLPFGFMRKGSMPWLSTMTTNAGILLAAALLIWVAGLAPFLSVHLPIVALGATAGVWLFYVQHQFEGTTWEAAREWSQPEAALHGSSFYELPPPLS